MKSFKLSIPLDTRCICCGRIQSRKMTGVQYVAKLNNGRIVTMHKIDPLNYEIDYEYNNIDARLSPIQFGMMGKNCWKNYKTTEL